MTLAVQSPPGPSFTLEQREAISDRSGSRILAANAGSGKTAVMVERFVEAVLEDDVGVGSILALTFTEKAAGELRERIRRRFTELGRADLSREADGAWVGTIHGFCARVLRTSPLAAGLDPRFEVLGELAAQRVAGAAFERALDAFVAERGPAGLDLAAAYGPALRDIVVRAYAELRSRGQTRPRLRVPPPAPLPTPRALQAAHAQASAHLAAAPAPGIRVQEGIAALEAGGVLLAGHQDGTPRVPFPAEFDGGTLGSSAAVLKEGPCEDYRTAFDDYRQACADHHARAALVLIGELLGRFDDEYRDAKAARAGVDFEDLELRVRDLLAEDPALRARWADRFALIMVDEFQDTNRLQLEVLEALERDNGFVVGDEFQSIYGFRHADVRIFRERRAACGEAGTRRLGTNFRSEEELLDVLNGAFAPAFGEAFTPLAAGRPSPPGMAAGDDGDALRLFDPDRGAPPVELLITDSAGWDDDPELEAAVGLTALADKAWRRAEARFVAQRLREEVDAGRREGEMVVLVRATASLPVLEQALEEEGLPTYVVGGRGYWSQEQVRDGLAYLRALANPLDEEALLGALASPFAAVGADGLVLAARAGREPGAGGLWAALQAAFAVAPPVVGEPLAPPAWVTALPGADRERLSSFARLLAAERVHAARLPAEVLLERAVAATGYDLAILARPDGERRLANLRKLMRLAREYERSEGRDLRGLLGFAATQELAAAREGEAPLEGEGLNAIRLMTIHRAKGLEFDVVCVADLGRGPGGAPDPLIVGRDGSVGLRLATPGGGATVPALGHQRLALEQAEAEAEEERRLLYVAMTRARERLILSGGIDVSKWPEPKVGRPPLTWIARAMLSETPSAVLSPAEPDRVVTHDWDGRPARVRARLLTPARAATVLSSPHRRTSPAATALPADPDVRPAPGREATELPGPPLPAARPRRLAPARLSYSSLGDYARCPYRFYLRRVVGLPDVPEPPLPEGGGASASSAAGLDPRSPRHARARAARGPRLPPPGRAGPHEGARARPFALRRRGGRGPRARRGLRPVTAVRPARRRRPRRAPRSAVRLRPRAGPGRPAAVGLHRRARHRARRRRPRRGLQDGPSRAGRQPGGSGGAGLYDPAPRLRARRAAQRGAARGGGALLSRTAAGDRGGDLRGRGRRGGGRRAAHPGPRGPERGVPRHRIAASGAVRHLPGPPRAVLAPSGADAATPRPDGA
jgi:ATP-dependent exoDNAse (exonuclease V) beta subunit